MSGPLLLAAAEDFAHEDFEQQLERSDEAGARRVRRQYETWVQGLHNDPDKARPEIDLRDCEHLTDLMWQHNRSLIRLASNAYLDAVGLSPDRLAVTSLAYDGERALADMQAAAALGW